MTLTGQEVRYDEDETTKSKMECSVDISRYAHD